MSKLNEKMQFWHFDDHLMIFSDGSIGGAFRLGGFDISCMTDEEVNGFSRHIENMLLSCDEG